MFMESATVQLTLPSNSAIVCLFLSLLATFATAGHGQEASVPNVIWSKLPPIPDELGLAGPIVGVHREMLIVGGGANFRRPVWAAQKQWLSELYGMQQTRAGYQWKQIGQFKYAIAYAACASTSKGIVIAGGNNSVQTFDQCWLLKWNAATQKIEIGELPKLPVACAYGHACGIGDVVYLAGGQSTSGLDSALSNLWRLDLSMSDDSSLKWEILPGCPGPPRAFNITVSLNNSESPSVFVMGGRYEVSGGTKFLEDCWEFKPQTQRWIARASLPRAICAGTAIGMSDTEIIVLSGDDGSLYTRTDELKDAHPGFPLITYVFNTQENVWREAAASPANQVTTLATVFAGQVIIPSGEIRPRVRTPNVWSVSISSK